MTQFDKFKEEQKHLVETLDKYYEKCSNSDFSKVIDRLSNVAENVIEENRKIDSSALLFKKKIQQFSSPSPNPENPENDLNISDNENNENNTISMSEFGRVIRLYQKEIENLIKRYNETSEIVSLLRNCLSNLPDITTILTDSINFLQYEVKPQIENLNTLRKEINDLKTSDSQIESIENQIKDVKEQRDSILAKINSEAQNNVENQRTNQVKQIEETVELIEKQKKEMENQIDQIKSEIAELDRKKIYLESKEQENIRNFLKESSEIENELANARSKLDGLKEIDLEKNFEDLRNELSQKNLELQQKQNLISSLRAELNLRSLKLAGSGDSDESLNASSSNIFLESDIEHLEEEIEEKQSELNSMPSNEEWQKISIELKKFQSSHNLESDDVDFDFISNYENNLNSEIANIESIVKNKKKDQVNLESKLNVIESQIGQTEKELQSLTLQNKNIIDNNDESALAEVLKIRKNMLNDNLLQKENEIHSLQREQNALDIRIKSLKEEKENLINFSNPSGSSFLQPIQINNEFNDSMINSGIRRNKKKKMKRFERKMLNLTDELLATPKKTFFLLLYLTFLFLYIIYLLFL